MMAAPDPRTRLRKAIFAACRRSGFDEEARHAVQLRVTGKRSMTQMDVADMRRLLAHLNGERLRGGPRKSREGGMRWEPVMDDTPIHGFPAPPEPKPIPDPKLPDLPDGPLTGKLRALWISAWWLGVVQDRGDGALASWVCRQTGYGSAKWMTPADGDRLVEALKGWMERDGGVDWSAYKRKKRPRRVPGARVMEALWRELHRAGQVPDGSPESLQAWVLGFRRAPDEYIDLGHRVHNQLIRELGRWLKRECG